MNFLHRSLFVFFAIVCSLNTISYAEFSDTRLQEIARSNAWLNLLHYAPEGRLRGSRLKSEVDSKEFFLHPQGHIDAYAELMASIHEMQALPDPSVGHKKIGPIQQTIYCAMPARRHFLEQQLGIVFPRQTCREFDTWIKALAPQTITLVFAAAYLGNPGSMFGHTFLRLDSKFNDQPILNHAIDFSAHTGADAGLFYAINGLFGLYRGGYSIGPFATKVREYTAIENRDLVEYKLNLKDDEIQRLLEHTWEMGLAYFDYYFLYENCSYHLLSLLEVARPGLALRGEFPLWVIPTETVRLLYASGLVSGVEFRGAFEKKLNFQYRLLSKEAQRVFDESLDNRSGARFEDISRFNVPTFDLVLEYLTFDRYRQRRNETEADKKERHTLLVKRAEIANTDSDSNVLALHEKILSDRARPELGEPPMKWSMGVGAYAKSRFVTLRGRFALHDLLEPIPGYLPDTTLELMSVEARFYDQSHKLVLANWTLVNLESYTPKERFSNALAWVVRVGARTMPDLVERPLNNAVHVLGGVGKSYQLLPWVTPRVSVVGLLLAQLDYAGVLQNNFRLAPTAELLVLVDGHRLKSRFSSQWAQYVVAPQFTWANQGVVAWSVAPRFEVRAEGKHWLFGRTLGVEGRHARSEFSIHLGYYL